jgi:hypothetical protein
LSGKRGRQGGHVRGKHTGPGNSGTAPSRGVNEEAGADIDALFRLPLSEFTAARNALATRLRRAGRSTEADAVQALPKPSIPAWAVNQLYWLHRRAFDDLLSISRRFYDAQVAQLSGKSVDIREPLDARRQALSDLSRLAVEHLRTAGHAATHDTTRRIVTTLEALSTQTAKGSDHRPGRLVEELEPPGFEALSPLVSPTHARRAEGPSRLLRFRDQRHAGRRSIPGRSPHDEAQRQRDAQKAAREEARAAVQRAERNLRSAQTAARAAEAALKKAAARAKEAERLRTDAEARFTEAAAVAETARAEARRVAAGAEEAAQAVEEAERALAQAKATFDAQR